MDKKVEIVLSEKVAILTKVDQIAAIGLAIRPWGTELSMFDNTGINKSPQYSPLKGIEMFESSLRTSLERGWKISYFGIPNHG